MRYERLTLPQVPARLASRCQLGCVMWNWIGYQRAQEAIDRAIAALPMREVTVGGETYLQIDQAGMEARS
jgi:hypothetical protein